MPKPDKQSKRPKDVNLLARHLVDLSTQESSDNISPPTKSQISMFMSEMGRKGGKIGGKRRLYTMTAEDRRRIAKKAAKARWTKEE